MVAHSTSSNNTNYNASLETLVEESPEPEDRKIVNYPRPYIPGINPAINMQAMPVSQSELPPGVLGQFSLITHRAVNAREQTPTSYVFTDAHEVKGHFYNRYRGVQDPEILADMQALEATGIPMTRPPEFYWYN